MESKCGIRVSLKDGRVIDLSELTDNDEVVSFRIVMDNDILGYYSNEVPMDDITRMAIDVNLKSMMERLSRSTDGDE